jgi:hypothetical protein
MKYVLPILLAMASPAFAQNTSATIVGSNIKCEQNGFIWIEKGGICHWVEDSRKAAPLPEGCSYGIGTNCPCPSPGSHWVVEFQACVGDR